MHTDYVSMGGKKFFTPLFLPYIRSTLEVHFFDFILGRATPFSEFFFSPEHINHVTTRGVYFAPLIILKHVFFKGLATINVQ